MRTRQFQRFAHQKMNQRFPENILPFYGLSLKKQKERTFQKRKTKSLQTEKQKNSLTAKLLQVYSSSIHSISSHLPGTKLQPIFSLDQINFELKRGNTQKESDFGYQLHERKKLRWFYGGLSTRILRRLLVEAKKTKLCATSTLFQTLEKRLDVALYRCGFFGSIYEARQWILQKRVLVNQRPIERPSYELQPGDFIEFEKKWHENLRRSILERFILFLKNSEKRNGSKNNSNNILFSVPTSLVDQNVFEKKMSSFSIESFQNFFKQFSNLKSVSQVLNKRRDPSFFRSFHSMKPLHLETSYKTFTCIYLYPPQKICFPSLIDIPAIKKSYSL